MTHSIKKFMLIICLFLISDLSFSQIINFRTVVFSCNIYEYSLHKWTGWSSWEDSNILITMDFSSDLVTIYSPSIQIYKVYTSSGNYYDSDGDFHILFQFIDQDGDEGTMRLLQRTSGQSEIYIEFKNVKWCYRVIRL